MIHLTQEDYIELPRSSREIKCLDKKKSLINFNICWSIFINLWVFYQKLTFVCL